MAGGAPRKSLATRPIDLIADLAVARSVFVTRTTSWQLPGIFRILPSTNAGFCFHTGTQKLKWGSVTSQMTSRATSDRRSRLKVTVTISYSLNEFSSCLSTVYSTICICEKEKLNISPNADGMRDFVSFENVSTKSRACSIFLRRMFAKEADSLRTIHNDV